MKDTTSDRDNELEDESDRGRFERRENKFIERERRETTFEQSFTWTRTRDDCWRWKFSSSSSVMVYTRSVDSEVKMHGTRRFFFSFWLVVIVDEMFFH